MNVRLLLVILLNIYICYYLWKMLKRTTQYSPENFYKIIHFLLRDNTLDQQGLQFILQEYQKVVKQLTDGDSTACGTLRVFNNTLAFGYENKNPYVKFETLPIYFRYDTRESHVHAGCRHKLSKRQLEALQDFTLQTFTLLDDYANPKPYVINEGQYIQRAPTPVYWQAA